MSRHLSPFHTVLIKLIAMRKYFMAGLGLTCGLLAGRADAQQPLSSAPPLTLVRPEGPPAAPLVITLIDAIERARSNDAQFQSAVAEAKIAGEDRVQARASLLPAFSQTTQYLGTQGDTPL